MPLRSLLILNRPVVFTLKVVLSAAMERAITAPRVEEEEALGAMLAAARGTGETMEDDDDDDDVDATKRVVSDKEWQLLQQEVHGLHRRRAVIPMKV